MTESRKSFSEMRRELAEKRGRTIQTEEESQTRPLKSVPQVDEDLIPDVLGERTEEDLQIDSIIDGIDLLDAYRRWIGKEVNEQTTNQREGIKVSCPIPGHRDKNPSAWLNLDKKTWFCGSCQEGGDLHDLAAIHFGYARPDYKEGKTFHELRQEMAESYGFRFKRISGQEIIWKEEEVEPVASATADEAPELPDDAPKEGVADDGSGTEEVEPEPAQVTTLHAKDVEDDVAETIKYPVLDWRSFVPEGTFLHLYMDATCNDDAPEEYHFWHGLLALGHSVGRKVYFDDTPDVYGNMLLCLLGGTGYGKSRSRRWLNQVLRAAVPWNDNAATGCKQAPVSASGENLINQFEFQVPDPSNPKAPPIRMPVNGIVDYAEFSTLLAKSGHANSSLKQTIMEFYDGYEEISSSSNTGGTHIAIEPFCSITTTTQPKAVRPLLSRTDASSGFLNRWLFIGGPKKKREVLGGTRSKIKVDLTPAIEELKRVRAWGATKRGVWFDSDETAEAFEKWILTTVDPMRSSDETELLTRLDLTLKRIALLFCINEKKINISLEDLERLKPILSYLVDCYGILSAEIGVTMMMEITDEILRHIKRIQVKTGRGVTARELGSCMKRKNYSPDLIKKALDTMVGLDWIDIDKARGPGRPTIRYKVVA